MVFGIAYLQNTRAIRSAEEVVHGEDEDVAALIACIDSLMAKLSLSWPEGDMVEVGTESPEGSNGQEGNVWAKTEQPVCNQAGGTRKSTRMERAQW